MRGKRLYEKFCLLTMSGGHVLTWADLPRGVQEAWCACYDMAYQEGLDMGERSGENANV